MRLPKYLISVLLLMTLISCGGSSSSASDSDAVTYSGDGSLETVANDNGEAVISSSSSNVTYDIKMKDEAGNPVSDVDITLREEGGNTVIVISDPEGKYGDIVMIGEPDEFENNTGRNAVGGRYNLDFVLKPRNKKNIIGFSTDALNLGYVYFSDRVKSELQSETGCYNPIEIINKFQSIYKDSYADGKSILSFIDDVSDSTAANVMYSSYLMQNEGYRMYAAFKTRLEYLYGASSGSLDDKKFSMTCYYPSDGIGFDTICEVTSNTDTCPSTVTPPVVTSITTPVEVQNSAPLIFGTPFTTATGDNAYNFYPAAYDADGDSLTFSIENKPSWASFSETTGALTGTPTEAEAGTYSGIIISVTDGADTASLAAFNIVVNEYNSAPFIGGIPYIFVTGDNAYNFYPAAYDADGDSLTFSIENKPSWASFSETTGALTGTPIEAEAGTYNDIIISVTDGTDKASLAAFSITVNEYNSAPFIGGTPQASFTAGSVYNFHPAVYDVDGDSLSFSIENKPYWASFSETTGALTGAAQIYDAGSYSNITISVTDGVETVSLPAFSIIVYQFNSAPFVGGPSLYEVASGDFFRHIPISYDADGDTLTFSIDTIPMGTIFNAATGELSGTLESRTSISLTITVSDSRLSHDYTFTLRTPM